MEECRGSGESGSCHLQGRRCPVPAGAWQPPAATLAEHALAALAGFCLSCVVGSVPACILQGDSWKVADPGSEPGIWLQGPRCAATSWARLRSSAVPTVYRAVSRSTSLLAGHQNKPFA